MSNEDYAKRLLIQDEILDRLYQVWHGGELRLGQLLCNLALPPDKSCPEVFYLDDEKLLEKLRELHKRNLDERRDGGTE